MNRWTNGVTRLINCFFSYLIVFLWIVVARILLLVSCGANLIVGILWHESHRPASQLDWRSSLRHCRTSRNNWFACAKALRGVSHSLRNLEMGHHSTDDLNAFCAQLWTCRESLMQDMRNLMQKYSKRCASDWVLRGLQIWPSEQQHFFRITDLLGQME